MTRCPKCGRSQPDLVEICDCGYDLVTYRQHLQAEAQAYAAVERPYHWLPRFQIVLRVLGGLCLAGGVIGALLLFAEEDGLGRAVLAVVGALVVATPYFVSAEVIALLLTMSDQQTSIHHTLRRIEQRQEKES